MKNTLLVASAALSLFSTAAFADDCDHDATPVPGYTNAGYTQVGYDNRRNEGFAHSNRGRGQYQLQTTQRWVPGAVTQVFVPGSCHRVPFSPIQACTPGRYVSQQQPGHYETVQEWVWVPRREHGHRHGREHYGRR